MTVLEATDVETIRQIFSEMYNVRRFTPNPEYNRIRVSRQTVSSLAQRHDFTFSIDSHVRGDPLHALYFGHIRTGAVTYHRGHTSHTYVGGEAFLAVQPDHLLIADLVHPEMDYTVLDESLLDQVAQGSSDAPDKRIHFTGYGPATAADTDLWLRTTAYVDDMAASAGDHALVTRAAARLLAATALSVFPNTAVVKPGSVDRRDAHPRTLRRAMTFLQEHAAEDISAADIAAAAGTSIRAVQLAFHHHLGTTPTVYLRRIRMQHAHDDLRAADPETTTVTQIAASWGFWNPGRFAAYYRSTFGCAPGDTLHDRSP